MSEASYPKHNSMFRIAGFTLVELLIVIGIVAVISIVIVLIINPVELLRQARDAKRLAELDTINKALEILAVHVPTPFVGNPNTVYVSLPDADAPLCSNNLGLPTLPSGWAYRCASLQDFRKVDGTGWIPVDFTKITGGTPFSVLPVDPSNNALQGTYYAYVTGGSYVVTALLESSKYLEMSAAKDGGTDPKRMELGTDLSLWAEASPSLRALADARGAVIGATARADRLGEQLYTDTLRREFNSMTPENELKMAPIHPEENRYEFRPADAIINFAEANNMKVRGHTLVWDIETPLWVVDPPWTFDEMMDIFKDHIRTVVGRYQGRISSWDVVNEALENTGSLRQSFVQKLGSEENFKILMASAFIWAKEADPSATLLISDSDVESGTKADAFFALVQDLQARGAPIDAVGFHAHLRLDDMMALGANQWKPLLAAAVQRFNNIGLEVQITELDVSIVLPATETELENQASVFSDVLDVCLTTQGCTAFNMWGFTDKYSWIPTIRPGEGAALIFDTSYNPKPSYHALLQRLSL